MGLKRFKSQRGTNAIEFALIAPVLFAILFGVVDYGWYFGQQVVLDRAVRAGARSASVQPQAAALATAETSADEAWTAYGLPGTVIFDPSILTIAGDVDLIRVVGTLEFSAPSGLTPVPSQLVSSIAFRLEDQGE
jgi:Flp pilus assembly protein TadG